MSAIGKALAAELTIHRQARAIAIAHRPDSATWTVTTERADTGETQQYTAAALVLAIPAPQILPLLEPLQSQGAIAALWQRLATVTYAPCITVMAQYPPPVTAPDSRLPCQPAEPWAIEGHSDTPFFWIGLDSSKRDAEGCNVVLHSSATFAEHWLDSPHLQPAGEALLAQAAKLIAPWLAKPARWQVHRWRYSQVEQPYGGEMPLIVHPAPLVTCGDWWGDRHLDTAIEAGWTAAATLNAQLDNIALPDSYAILFL
jgi:predicted NAD/FAD-dependent oxidoreductase